MPIISALWRLRQEDKVLKASLGYKWDPISKKKEIYLFSRFNQNLTMVIYSFDHPTGNRDTELLPVVSNELVVETVFCSKQMCNADVRRSNPLALMIGLNPILWTVEGQNPFQYCRELRWTCVLMFSSGFGLLFASVGSVFMD
jgi:hypothetical protein